MIDPETIEAHSLVDARFVPLRVDDLKHGVDQWINRREFWIAMWKINEEDGVEYVGEWAMAPIVLDDNGGIVTLLHPEFPYTWVPSCDLSIVKMDLGSSPGPSTA